MPGCYRAGMGIQLSELARRLVDGRNYAVLATVNPDGSPQTSVVWVGRDGGDLLFSTVEGRVKHRNMVRDPRVSVSIIDSADPENYVELRGRVSMAPDIGRRVDTQLSWKYDGRTVDEEKPAVQCSLPDSQRLGVVGRGVPRPQSLHARELHDDDPAVGRPVSFGYHRHGAADEVAAAVPGDRGRRQFAIAPTLRLIHHLDFGDHVRGHDVMISRPRRRRRQSSGIGRA
jgi:PPOX class probable F420-dependent enzyme